MSETFNVGQEFVGSYPIEAAGFCNANGYRIEKEERDGSTIYKIVKGIERSEQEINEIKNAAIEFSINKELSKQIKKAITMMVSHQISTMSEEQMLEVGMLFNEWTVGDSYSTGDVVRYSGGLYQALQDSIAQEFCPPDTYIAGWKRIGEQNEEGIYPWSQPFGATDAYALGAKVIYNGKTYESEIANNVWAPDVYGWKEVTSITEEPEEPSVEEYPEWVQPQGAHDAYSIGDKVTYNDRYWVSNTNGNVWVPGEYGWDEVV